MSDFEQLIEQGDVDAVQLAPQLGAAAVPSISKFLDAEDIDARLVAWESLAALGDAAPAQLLVDGLSSSDGQVRVAMANALLARVTPADAAAIAPIWTATTDHTMRVKLAMVLGNSGQPKALSELSKDAPAADDEVATTVLAARGKLGDAVAQSEFGELLASHEAENRVELIELAAWIQQRWVVAQLAPALGDRALAINLSNHRRELYRRPVDLAIDTIAAITGVAYTFAVDPIAQYDDAQIAEVQGIVAAGRY